MADSNPVMVPIEPNMHLVRSPNNSMPSLNVPYQKAVSSLMYATYSTHPDIAYAIQTLSQFNENPQTSHWAALKCILCYLQSITGWGILFSASEGQSTSIKVIGYSDADWGTNPNDCKSITSYAFLLGGAPISWASRKQKSMALSSMEAKYMTATSATSQAL
jgi:hypothetical protein